MLVLLPELVESLSRHERYSSKAEDVLAFVCICGRSQLGIDDEIVEFPIGLFICEAANTGVTMEKFENLVRNVSNYGPLVTGYKN